MASFVYNSFFYDLAKNDIDLEADTFYVLLVNATYTPDRSHAKRSDITGEVSGSGYGAGGKPVTLTIQPVDNVNNDVEISISAVSWDPSTITASGAVLYKHRGGAASADELVQWFDFGGIKESSACPFELTFPTNMRVSYE